MFSLWGSKVTSSVVLIQIDSASVGGAYALLSPKQPPRIYFTARFPIDAPRGTPTLHDMMRTLPTLVATLSESGKHALVRETGSAHIDTVIVSLGSPWQDTTVRVRTIGDGTKDFTFTRAMLEETSAEKDISPGRRSTGELVVASILNGYEITRPVGKRAKRADLIILSSSVADDAAAQIEDLLRQTYHTTRVEFTAFAPVVYTVFRDVYPHEHEFLIVNLSGATTDVVFVKGGLLVDVASFSIGANHFSVSAERALGPETLDLSEKVPRGEEAHKAQTDWVNRLSDTGKEFASRHALPRTIFLMAPGNAKELAKTLLDAPALRALWLSEEPLRVVPVTPAQFAPLVQTRGSASGDVTLALLALFERRRQNLG